MFKRFMKWCRTIVSRGMNWIEQQIMNQTKPSSATIVVGAVGDALRSRKELLLENALLRQQLVILKRSVKRVQPTDRDRRVLVWLTSRLKGWREALLVVKPETILAWHRTLFRLFWRQKSRGSVGRPRLSSDTVALIKQIAMDNRLWGAERIQGELLKLGIKVSKRTIQKYMRQARPNRPSGQTWSTFLHNHAHQVWACDFLPIVDLFFRQFYAFFIVELGSRRVVHVGVTAAPTDAWVAQQLREATPFGEGPKYLIRDNDSKYGLAFATVAAGANIKVLKTPIAAPNANAVCERFLGSVRRECLDHLLLVGQRSITRVLKEYVDYFNHLRPHQGINQRIPEPSLVPERSKQPTRITRTPILGGLHHAYQPAA
jgi:putative transposase